MQIFIDNGMQPDDSKMMLVCHQLLVNLRAQFPASVWSGLGHCCTGKCELGASYRTLFALFILLKRGPQIAPTGTAEYRSYAMGDREMTERRQYFFSRVNDWS